MRASGDARRRTMPWASLLRGLWLAILLSPFVMRPPLWPASTAGRAGVVLALVALSLVAWTVFRTATTRGQVLWLGFLGSAVLLSRILSAADGEVAKAMALPVVSLFGYLVVGLVVLGSLQTNRVLAAATAACLVFVPVAAAGAASTWLGFGFSPALASTHLRGLGTVPGSQGGATDPDGSLRSLSQIDINRPVTLSDMAILTISGAPTAAYWSVAKYDNFDGRSWTGAAAASDVVIVNPRDGGVALGDLLPPALSPAAPSVSTVQTWNVTVHRSTRTNVPLIYTGAPTALSGLTGATAVQVDRGLQALSAPGARSYTVKLTVPSVDVEALAGVGFASQKVAGLERDLAIPANTSPKVGELARSIVSGATGPWNAAQMVADYLKVHGTYTTQLSPASRSPGDGNAVNQFLLGDERGFCDQFSTSFIVLMRELGVPARWVVGYKVGENDRGSTTGNANGGNGGSGSDGGKTYVVHASNAHSWAEVHVTPLGWVPIDPTPGGQVAGSYLAPTASTSPDGGVGGSGSGSTADEGGSTPNSSQSGGGTNPGSSELPTGATGSRSVFEAGIGGAILAVIAILAAAILVAVIERRRRWRSKGPGSPAAMGADRLWRSLVQVAARAESGLDPAFSARKADSLTPRELLRMAPAGIRPSVAAAINLLERVWYGDEKVAAADIAAAKLTLHASLRESARASAGTRHA